MIRKITKSDLKSPCGGFRGLFAALAFLAISTGAQAQLNWSGTQTLTAGQVVTDNITLTGNVTISVPSGTAEISGVISENFTITKQGAGKLILTGENTYTGSTTVSAGILQIGNGAAGSINATSNVVNNATLRFEPGVYTYFDKVISGSGNVEYTGSGRFLYLTANNTYTGTTTIEIGQLYIGDNSATGAVAGDIIVSSNGILFFSRSNEYTYSGVISGDGRITKQGAGKTILTGANTYTGSTTVSGGTLQLGNGTANGSIDNTSNVVLNNANTILRFEPGADMTFSRVISGYGKVEFKGGSKTLYFTADNNYSGTTTIESGYLYLGKGGTTGSVTGNIINNEYLTFCRSNDYTYSGVISGVGKVDQYSASKLTLNGINTFTGTTSISGSGTLALGTSGSIENSNMVYFWGNNTKFDISAGNKTIKYLQGVLSNTEIILGSSVLTIGTAGQNNGGGTYAGIFSGTGGVTKQGTGTFTINSAANTATGIFTLKEGILKTNYSIWKGNFTQDAGTVLNMFDSFSVGGNLTLNGGNIEMDLTGAKMPILTVLSPVSTSGTTTFKITANSAITNYVLIQAASGITSTTPYALNMPGMSGTLSVQMPTKLLLTAVPTAIDNVQADNLKIYVVNGELRIENGELRIEKVEVVDLSGKSLLSQTSNLSQINVAHLASGIYFVKITTDSGIVTRKFVKE